MVTQAWMISAQQRIEWYMPDALGEWPEFCHMSSNLLDPGNSGAPRCGHSLWMARIGERHAAVAWDWAEVQPGVVALADPNATFTNICFHDVQGAELEPLLATVCANRIVHRLPWQAPVLALLAQTPPTGDGHRPQRQRQPRHTAALAA